MKIEIIHLGGIERLTHVAVALIRCAYCHCIGACKLTIDMIIGRCARKHIDLEGFSLLMKFLGAFCQCNRHYFWSTGSGET